MNNVEHNWVALAGKIVQSNGELIHEPISPVGGGSGPSAEIIPFTMAKSDLDFSQGEISMDVWLDDGVGKCMIGLKSSEGYDVFAGLNVLGVAHGFAIFRNNQWEAAGGTGFEGLPAGKWLNLRLDVHGSSLELYFQHVNVMSYTREIQKSPLALFMQSNSHIKVKNIKVTKKTPVCFVVMQFTDEFNDLYSEVIKPTCENFGFTVNRADDSYTSGLIIEDITRSIKESSLVIADITPDNPNVFYEVGFAHGISKPTILLSDRSRQKLPFDVSGFRTIFYDNTIKGKSDVEERLKKHLASIGA